MEIELGSGAVKITTITRGDRIGILLEPVQEGREPGSYTFDDVIEPYHVADKDVVIWIDKLISGRVLQDILSQAILLHQRIIK